jgi:hypothetical protein
MQYFDQTWYDCTIDRVREITKGKESFLLFDVGAGNSVLEKRVQAMGGQWKGFDYKPRKAGIIELNLEKPIPSILANENPDVILLLEVIEHLFNPGQAISNLAMMAKKGTYLVLTTPNPFWSVVRLKFLFLNKFPMFEKSDMDDNHHVFTAWPHVMEKLLIDNGFQVIHQFTTGHSAKFPRFTVSIQYPAKILVYILRKFLEKSTPLSKGMCFGMVALKK